MEDTQKMTRQLYTKKARVNSVESVCVDFDENSNVVIHVPEGFVATLQTSDFRRYTVKLAKI